MDNYFDITRGQSMYKWRIIAVFSLIILLCVSVVWYWNNYSTAPSLTVIKVGALLPSATGDLVVNREKMINGLELAKEDLTAKYKNRVRIDIDYEDGCFPSESIPAVQKFINDGVVVIAASFCLFGHLPILPMTEGNKIITFNTAANPEKALHLHYAFSTNVEVKNEGKKLSEFAYSNLGARRAVLMFLDTPFGHDYSKSFTRDFISRGGDVVGKFPNAPDGKKFETIVAKIKLLKPDVIITAHFGVPLALFIREIRHAGITVPIVGNYETEDSTVLTYAGLAAEGVIFSSSELPKKTSRMKNFETNYIRKFGTEPGVLASNSYDDLVLAVESYLKCKGNRDCIADELHKVKNYQGASGVITIKTSGATDKPTIFKIIRSNTFLRYHEKLIAP